MSIRFSIDDINSTQPTGSTGRFTLDDIQNVSVSNYTPQRDMARAREEEEEDRKRREAILKVKEQEYQKKKEKESRVFNRVLEAYGKAFSPLKKNEEGKIGLNDESVVFNTIGDVATGTVVGAVAGAGIGESIGNVVEDFNEKRERDGLLSASVDLGVNAYTEIMAGGAKVVGEDIPFYFGSMFYGKGEQEKVRIAREEGRREDTLNLFTNVLIANELNMAMEGALVQDLKSARLAGDTEKESQIIEQLKKVQENREVDPESANRRKGVFDTRSNEEMLARYSERTHLQVAAGFAELALDVATGVTVGGKAAQSGRLVKETAIEGAQQVAQRGAREGVERGTREILQEGLKGSKQAVIQGAGAGAGYGALGALEEGADNIGDVATGTVVGAVAGAGIGGALNFGLTGVLPAMSYSTGKQLGRIPMVQKFQAEQVLRTRANDLSNIISESVGDFIDVNRISVPNTTPEMMIRKAEAVMELMQLEGLSVGGRIIDIPAEKMADFNAIQTNILQPIVDELTIAPNGTKVDIGAIEKAVLDAKDALELHGITPSTRQIAPTPASVVVDDKIVNGVELTDKDINAVRTEMTETTGTPMEVREKTVDGLDKLVDDTNRVNTPVDELEGKSVEYKVGDKTVKGTVEGDTLKLESGRVIPLDEQAKQNILQDADFVDGVAGKSDVTNEVVENLESKDFRPVSGKETPISTRKIVTLRDTETGEVADISFVKNKKTGEMTVEREWVNSETGEKSFSDGASLKSLKKKYGTNDPEEIARRYSLFKNEISDTSEFLIKGTEVKDIPAKSELSQRVEKFKQSESAKLTPEEMEIQRRLGYDDATAKRDSDLATEQYLNQERVAIQEEATKRISEIDKQFAELDTPVNPQVTEGIETDIPDVSQTNVEDIVNQKNTLLQEKNEAIDILAQMRATQDVDTYRKSLFLENQKQDYPGLSQITLDEKGNITEESLLYVKKSFELADNKADIMYNKHFETANKIALGEFRSDDIFLDTRISLKVADEAYKAGDIARSLEINKRLSIEGTQAGQAVKALDTAPGEYSAGKAVRDTYRELYNRKGGKEAVKKSVKEVKENIVNSIKSISVKDLKGIIDKNICKV